MKEKLFLFFTSNHIRPTILEGTQEIHSICTAVTCLPSAILLRLLLMGRVRWPSPGNRSKLKHWLSWLTYSVIFMPWFWDSAANFLDSHLLYFISFFKEFSPSSGRYISSVITFSLCNWKSHQFCGFLQMQFSWRENTNSRTALTAIWAQTPTFPYTSRSHSCRNVCLYIWFFSQNLLHSLSGTLLQR